MERDIIEIRKEKTIELLKLVSNLDNDWGDFDKNKPKLLKFLNQNSNLWNETTLHKSIENLYLILKEPYNEIKIHFLRQKILEYRFKKYYFVYKHTVPNGKVYIGVTCQTEAEFRWNSGYKKNILFSQTIDEYGWDNIKHEILFKNLTAKEASSMEKKLIAENKSNDINFGYNIDKGGRLSQTREKLWKYDLLLQFRGRRRPFKIIIPNNYYEKFENILPIYDSYVQYKIDFERNGQQCFYIVAPNYSFKEKTAIKSIKEFFQILVDIFNLGEINLDFKVLETGIKAQYDLQKNSIVVNTNYLQNYYDSIEEIVFDISHEYRHKFQKVLAYEVSDLVIHSFENIAEWRSDMETCATIDCKKETSKYYSLSIEMDANAFAEAVLYVLKEEKFLYQITKSRINTYYNISKELGLKYENLIKSMIEAYFSKK